MKELEMVLYESVILSIVLEMNKLVKSFTLLTS